MARFVLDAWSLVSLFQDEPAAPRVRAILEGGPRGEHELYLTVVNLGEVSYTLEMRQGVEATKDALFRIDAYGVRTFNIDRLFALEAAKLKATRRLGYADSFAAALAQRLGAIVLTGDRDFQRVEDLVPIEWLI